VVAVADRALSFGAGGDLPAAESAVSKAYILGASWHVLFAGDPSAADAIVARAEQTLPSTTRRASRGEVERAFKTAYKEEVRKQVADNILSRFNLDWTDRAIASGRRGEITKAILEYDLNTVFLIFGSDEAERQHLFQVNNPGAVVSRDKIGYWAIGIGDRAAFAQLNVRLVTRLPVEHLVYRLCEAKFACEGVDGVKEPTNVIVVNRRGEHGSLGASYIDQLREIWERERRATPPSDTIDIVKQAFRTMLP